MIVMGVYGTFKVDYKGTVKMGDFKKPPLGLEPRWIHDSHRVKEILDAMERYTNANMSIPIVWLEELKDLFSAYFKEA